MAEEEFEESEVIFSDDNENNKYLSYQEMVSSNSYSSNGSKKKMMKMKKKKTTKAAANSIPMNINIQYVVDTEDHQFEEEYEIDEDGEIVPPHVIIGRRIAGKMAFSVCTGNGRTLKGRDLSQVRNSILRLTGFLET